MDPDKAIEHWGAIQPVPPRTMSERMNNPSFAGIVVCTLLMAVPFIGLVAFFVDLVMILRYVFGHRAPGSAQWSVHHPSVTSLIVVWVVALFTIVVYPLAFYMTWRFFRESQDRRRAGSKVCPRCAETLKAAALVCRQCGQEFESPAALPAEASMPVVGPGPGGGDWAAPTRRRFPGGYGVLVGAVLAAVAVVGLISLTFLGGQVSRVSQVSGINGAASLPPCVLVLDGPAGRLEMWLHGASVAQCEAQLAVVRESVGPDSPSSRLYLTGVAPSGKPVCTKTVSDGVVDVFTSGSIAASLGSQVCASLSP